MIIDIIFILIVIFFTLNGLKRGFILEVLSLFSIIISIYLVPSTLKYITYHFNFKIDNKYLMYFLTFIGIYILISVIFFIISYILDKTSFGILNKLLGAVFGFIKSTIILFFIFTSLLFLKESSYSLKKALNESFTIKYMSIYLNKYNNFFPKFIKKKLNEFRYENLSEEFKNKILKDFEKGNI